MKVLNMKDMPEDTMKRLKVLAAERGVTMRELVIEAIRVYLGRNVGK